MLAALQMQGTTLPIAAPGVLRLMVSHFKLLLE